jgi:NAD(P)-dependent dehydrogenase (short-subunit alcohol dehydrogenase family)
MRRILVTGANKGIGRALVSAILESAEDTHVYLGARDLRRGEDTRASLVAAHPAWASRVEVVQLDVADDASVARAAAQLADKLGRERLYGVVNNAGIGVASTDLAGILDVNARGVRRVCEAMLPLLASDGRVVNVTSAAGPSFVATCDDRRKQLFTNPGVTWSEIEAVMTEALAIAAQGGNFAAAGLGSGDSYGLSKACANAVTLAFAREHPGLHVNACTPGFIETDLTRPYVEGSGKSATELGMKSPAEGTRSAMHLLFGTLDGNGRYYGSDAQRSPLDRYRAPGSPAFTGP